MKTAYTFSVLRYVHDPVTAEFVNIGVALYAPAVKYLNAICTSHYRRLSVVFEPIDGDHFRQITKFLESRIELLGQNLNSELPFANPPGNIEAVLAQVLPADDSAIQFSTAGGGFTSDPEKTLNELYVRYVERYVSKAARPSRDDEEVWKVFRAPLERRQVIKYLRPKRIVAPDYDYEFTRARKTKCGTLMSRYPSISQKPTRSRIRLTGGSGESQRWPIARKNSGCICYWAARGNPSFRRPTCRQRTFLTRCRISPNSSKRMTLSILQMR
jgi:hypothetical protein